MEIQYIAKRFDGQYKRRFFSGSESKKLREFLKTPSMTNFHNADGSFRRVSKVTEIKEITADSFLIQMPSDAFAVRLLWKLRTDDDVEVIMELNTLLQISDPETFVSKWFEKIKASDIISLTTLKNELTSSNSVLVADTAKQYTYDQLRNQNALSEKWWKERILEQSLQPLGLTVVELTSVTCESPTLKLQKELDELKQLQKNEIEKERLHSEYEIELEHLRAKTDQQKQEIEHNQTLKKNQRQAEIERLDQQACLEQQALCQNLELDRLKYEKERIELESNIADIRNQPKMLEELKQQLEANERRSNEITETQREWSKSLNSTLDIIKELVEKQIPVSKQAVLQLAGISSEKLVDLGYGTSKEYFSTIFKELTHSNHFTPVRMKMSELCTRDISCGAINTLRIQSPLAFQFISPITGYATIINLGTSGNYWLHTPNAYIDEKSTKIRAGQEYDFPGDKLLPVSLLQQNELIYEEEGPVGWEELLVLVTPRPLINRSDLASVHQGNPFASITVSKMEAILEQLGTWKENEWSAGLLGFTVTE